jgi:DNA-binding LacI/PurR family transcriptional regulator
MAETPARSKLSHELANRIVQDIRKRKLKSGARYETTAEVCKRFDVSLQTAATAMARLAERKILVRLRKRGTFIGPAPAEVEHVAVMPPRLIFLMRPVRRGSAIPSFVTLPILLQRAMPAVIVQTFIVERGADVDVLRQAVNLLPFGAPLAGIVTGDRDRPLYEALAALDVPTVVFGTLEAGVPDLPSVGLDYTEAGRTLAACLIRRGHRRLAVQLAANAERDHVFADAIADACAAARLPPTALRVRTYSNDDAVTVASLVQLLSDPSRPTAIITRGSSLAGLAHAAANQCGLRIGADLDIAWADECWRTDVPPDYTYIEPLLTGEELAERIAGMLTDQAAGRPLQERHVFVPTRLHEAGC